MLKVISFKICPFVQRVTALLEAKNLEYEVEFISLSNKPQWFLDISPNGQVPVLITESGTPIFESDAIIEYLEEAYPPLQKDVPLEQKAVNRAWSYLATKNYLVQCGAQRSPTADDLKNRSEKLGGAFDKIENELDGSKYFHSDTLGTVDIAWITLLHRAEIIRRNTGYDFLGDRPKLKQWQQNILQTGLAEKSVADDFDTAFKDFYLSENTYLGRGCDALSDASDQACGAGSCC